MEDPELEAALLAGNSAYKDEHYEPIKQKLEYYCKELKRVGVRCLILWKEYKTEFSPNHYCYSQFCVLLRQYKYSSKPSMVLEHHAADKLYIDYAGKKLSYINKTT